MDTEALHRQYRMLFLIRRVEEEICRLYPSDEIKSPVHLSIGQEAVAVAVCDQLRTSDVLFGTYRGHANYLAKGGDLARMWAELYGRSGGCARGKAGSMHLVDTSVNAMGTSAIVASGIPNAVGYALALQMQERDDIVVCFHGEGAADEGVHAESVNFASLHRLPIVFVCENNGYAIYSHQSARMAGPGLPARMEAMGVPAATVDDGDFFSMLGAAGTAIAEVRAGFGPRYVEIATARWRDHVGPTEDRHWGYRSDDELDAHIADDQVARVGAMFDTHLRIAIEEAVEAEIAEAIAFAEASPLPDPEEVYANVFAG